MKDKSLKEIAKKVVDSNYFVLIAVWIIMCIVFTKLQSNFFSYRNMLNILTSGSLVGLLCIGEAYLIIAGMIELSAGAVAAFSGVLAAILARHQGIWSGEAEQYLLAHAEAISHD